ncbi:DUF2218 domain-containing protein [Billgrantia endophytica]|uniref:DUF2218 domain-containing protein n=1 Tax=Billgrantia endophytica TaxID=2033802 RepID=A0A2N7U6A7_9GAMM|nr:DUF2218 domain-containing protein [Halomonas endophytica]PMR75959.1 DUF2218 domain-containing protein [Halomonas endophytica]
MPMSRTEIATESAAKLMNRLCKHWAHKLEVEQGDTESRVAFEDGSCLMQVEPGKLIVAIETLEEESLDRLEGIVNAHLERMAGDEDLVIVWEN